MYIYLWRELIVSSHNTIQLYLVASREWFEPMVYGQHRECGVKEHVSSRWWVTVGSEQECDGGDTPTAVWLQGTTDQCDYSGTTDQCGHSPHPTLLQLVPAMGNTTGPAATAVDEHPRSSIVPGEGPYLGLFLVKSTFQHSLHIYDN